MFIKYIQGRDLFIFRRRLIFLYVVKSCPFWLKFYITFSTRPNVRTSFQKFFKKFEPNLTTFYYIRTYMIRLRKTEKVCLNGLKCLQFISTRGSLKNMIFTSGIFVAGQHFGFHCSTSTDLNCARLHETRFPIYLHWNWLFCSYFGFSALTNAGTTSFKKNEFFKKPQ